MSYRRRNRASALRRDSAKLNNYGAKIFHEVKRYDGEGKLIETITPDELMASPIGSTIKRRSTHSKRVYQARLNKTNGEGSMREWSKVSTNVKKGAKVGYRKEKV
tara:strand:- start:1686 stop:2000 length:315 start_codon:yes stop_codon:yes gene_type:complete